MFVDMLSEYASVVPAGTHGMEVPGREIILRAFARSVNFFRAEGIQSPADLRRALMSSRAEIEEWMRNDSRYVGVRVLPEHLDVRAAAYMQDYVQEFMLHRVGVECVELVCLGDVLICAAALRGRARTGPVTPLLNARPPSHHPPSSPTEGALVPGASLLLGPGGGRQPNDAASSGLRPSTGPITPLPTTRPQLTSQHPRATVLGDPTGGPPRPDQERIVEERMSATDDDSQDDSSSAMGEGNVVVRDIGTVDGGGVVGTADGQGGTRVRAGGRWRGACQTLDEVDIDAVLRVRVPTLQAVPGFMRGVLRNALRLGLEHIVAASRAGDAQLEAQAWKLFVLISRMLLHKKISQKLIPKNELRRRALKFQEGRWRELLAEAQASPENHRTSGPRQEPPEETELQRKKRSELTR